MNKGARGPDNEEKDNETENDAAVKHLQSPLLLDQGGDITEIKNIYFDFL